MLMILGVLAAIIGFALEHTLIEAGRVSALVAAVVLIAVIGGVSMRVAHHAEILAHKVGEPYGTMILTLSAVLVEVLILAILMANGAGETLVRDTIYAAVMIDINGILGLAALVGGLKHGEQPYNDDSGRTYLVMIATAMSISMIVPEFVPDDRWHAYSAFTIGAMIVLYALFLRRQVGEHSYFFSYSYPKAKTAVRDRHAAEPSEPGTSESVTASIVLLIAGVALIGVIAEVMSQFLNAGIEGLGAPIVLVAIVVAALSAAPEILTALRAALRNRMQNVINIALGASLSTVILTVPVMEAIALFTGQPFVMAMTPVQTVMVAVTLLVAAINLSDGETNAIEGMTHFVLFATFLMLSFIGL
ncbi:calcium:proton antiporter [Devosia rhodophyticola]|uniref:Calcium:proton antiporter n=1 Tax=Devosia rhodophyticola TaxID=3026423 RepID=A0ABY7Z2P8_9HYPH|nr:calcium:proton antiporter [Devosia rhodophyticola]WDR07480.1 calcium:proton antiporter [Devosia rhodophyticola]